MNVLFTASKLMKAKDVKHWCQKNRNSLAFNLVIEFESKEKLMRMKNSLTLKRSKQEKAKSVARTWFL
ncbi:hypothetical protein OE903_23055 [Bacillus sp. B6(2022)]|nr:hypothetical protein [Bacillus sp. B6(2022)]